MDTYRSGPKIDPILDLAVLKPAPTVLVEDGPFVKFVEMRVDVVDGFLFHIHALDGFELHLSHHLNGVLDCRLYARQQGPVGPSGARTDDGVVIWKSIPISNGDGSAWRLSTSV